MLICCMPLWSTWRNWNVHGGWFCTSDPELIPHSLLPAALEEAAPLYKKERTSCCCLSSLSKHLCKYGQLTSASYVCGKCSEIKQDWRSQRSVVNSIGIDIFPFLVSDNLFSPISNCSVAHIFPKLVRLQNGTHLCPLLWRAGARVVMGIVHRSLIYLVKWASHGDTYSGHLSKFLNWVKPIWSTPTSMCSFVQFGRQQLFPVTFFFPFLFASKLFSVRETKSKVTFLLSSTICR